MNAVSENKFGSILKELRKLRKLTQEDVSSVLKTDRSNIANYERGKRLPSLDTLIKIADFFDVSLDYLVLGRKPGQGGDEDLDETTRELMAENTALMETEVQLHKIVKERDKEIKLLKNLVDSLKQYNNFLEDNHKEGKKNGKH